MILPVILAGGSGERLWPLSRKSYPKQFINISNEYSLLQNTILRLPNSKDFLDPLIVCHEDYSFLVQDQLEAINKKPTNIILETLAKNTAPAIAFASFYAKEKIDEDIKLLVLPADHLIKEPQLFWNAVYSGIDFLQEHNKIITLGIKPNKAETGYGYIKQGNIISNNVYELEKFLEKPNYDIAQNLFESKQYLWNSGMFLFKAKTFLQELESHEKSVFNYTKKSFYNSTQNKNTLKINLDEIKDCKSISIDYAVMEKTKLGATIPIDSEAKWSDIGTWDSLWEQLAQGQEKNYLQGDIIANNVTNSYIRTDNKKVIALGIKDTIVVETADATLIAAKDQQENLKSALNIIKNNNGKEAIQHLESIRPWGKFKTLALSPRFQVKSICVQPGKSLSLQLHFHRSEHWVVVKGTAKVTRGEENFLLSENESTYIPIGTKHRLENVGKIPLEIIEVQSGSYLGEDDIVRLEDAYGRISNNQELELT